MATKTIFIEENGKEIIPFEKDKNLIIEIRDKDNPALTICLPKADAKKLIMELYRIGKKL